MRIATHILVLIIPLMASAQPAPDTIRLYFLGGQSNMEGWGNNLDLPHELLKEMDKVYIFHGNPARDGNALGGQGIWEPLQPGHGAGFYSDGQRNYLSPYFGPELSFARQMQEYHPDEKIALIKYSCGGTSIDPKAAMAVGCWEPHYQKISQYNHFISTLQNALSVKDINNDGVDDILIPSGILWMQGEADACVTEAIAQRYFGNLTRLMYHFRYEFKNDTLPIVIGKISSSSPDPDHPSWPYLNIVNAAQERFAQNDAHTAIIRETENYSYRDPAHYNSESLLGLGKRFAEAIIKLSK